MPCIRVDSLSRLGNPVKVWPVFGQEKTPPFGGAFGPGGLVPRCVGDAGPGGTLVYIGEYIIHVWACQELLLLGLARPNIRHFSTLFAFRPRT